MLFQQQAFCKEHSGKESVSRNYIERRRAYGGGPMKEIVPERKGLRQENSGHSGGEDKLYKVQCPDTRMCAITHCDE